MDLQSFEMSSFALAQVKAKGKTKMSLINLPAQFSCPKNGFTKSEA